MIEMQTEKDSQKNQSHTVGEGSWKAWGARLSKGLTVTPTKKDSLYENYCLHVLRCFQVHSSIFFELPIIKYTCVWGLSVYECVCTCVHVCGI